MYRHVCTITYLYIPVYTWYIHVYKSMYMYKHVYTWYRRVYTILPNPAHMVRIPDDLFVLLTFKQHCSTFLFFREHCFTLTTLGAISSKRVVCPCHKEV
jgi:hypothetical protein